MQISLLLAVVSPALTTLVRTSPMLRWLCAVGGPTPREVPAGIARRAADAPRALAAFALITVAIVVGLDLRTDPLLARVVSVMLFIAVTAAIGGAWLAWLFARSIAHPLELLEAAMARLREGVSDTRVVVESTDEIGTVTEGFYLMCERLSRTHAE
jgi:methyl-accepting chemotaxis protein